MRMKSDYGNVTPKIAELADRQLLKNPGHPLGILKKQIETFFTERRYYKSELLEKNDIKFAVGDNFSPIVTAEQNFDELLIPKDHVSRKRSDTYYITKDLLLKTHATAHEKQMFDKGNEAFIIFSKKKLSILSSLGSSTEKKKKIPMIF